MWRNNDNSDTVLKEALLRQLSQTVKEVQLFYSKTGEICSTQEGVSALVTVLEAIFLHGLKRSILESAKRAVSVTEDAKPTPSFFKAVIPITHINVLKWIYNQGRVDGDVGFSRVWIRVAINDGAISSYLRSLQTKKMLSKFYKPSALLRDREALDTAARLLEGLISVHFDVPINSSLLNSWSSEPLLMSGLWAPALRPTVHSAVDVAKAIPIDVSPSISTPSSSVRSLMILDETQALQIILGSSLPEDNLPEEIANEVDKTMKELEMERKVILEKSSIVGNCSPPQADACPQETPDKHCEQQSEEILKTEPEETSNPADLVRSYSEIFSEAPIDEDGLLKRLLQVPDVSAETRDTRLSIEEAALRIPREKSLKEQRFGCAECYLSIGFHCGQAILCNLTGELLCENCHKSEMSVIPAKILFNWDHVKYAIGHRAAQYVAQIQTQPIFDIEKINPKLYSALPDLRKTLRLRKQLNLIHLYLSTCKETMELPVKPYMYESPHLYSLADLIALPGESFKADLQKGINIGKAHVLGCWICKEKGFICEFCRDPEVIYPFDDGTIYRCSKCKAVYHEKCLSDKGKSCPKCKRREKRE